MGSLYECLREARLDKFYPTLRANGFSSAESLIELFPEDVAALGVVTPDEERRLYELVDIIRSVYEVDIEDLPNVSEATAYSVSIPVNNPNQRSKPARKRNHSPVYATSNVPPRRITGNSHRVQPSLRRHMSFPEAPRPRFERLEAAAYPEDSDSSNDDIHSDSSGPSDYEPATKHVNRALATPPRIRKTSSVERVKHTTGYNYGVPGNKAKQRSGSFREDSNESKIKVCVRKRPRNKREVRSADDDVVIVERADTITVHEPKLAVDLTPYTLQHEFCFDEVFHEGCGNEEVFERAAKPLIDCVFQGGSATCFAYGQTGAGKTHTMLGSREQPGLYLLAAQEIFSISQSGQYGNGLKVWVSFFEIYCGQLFDLLNRRNRLHAREDGSHRVCIAGLTETQVTDVPSIMQVLEYGNQVRSKGSTGVNPDSSRSHAVLQVEVRTAADRRQGRIIRLKDRPCLSLWVDSYYTHRDTAWSIHFRMSFIDLAGSERAADVTDTDRQTRLEGAEINQSLLALKECIRSIDQDSRHTPFRQSKLTHILKDSFIGNSRTCMIANVSPTYTACENTMNTLRYADRVKELRKNLRASKAIAQTVLNVPLVTPPSIFHPSSINCSSTPLRPKPSRKQTGRRSPPVAVLPDPAETPIRGNFSGIRKNSKNSVHKQSASAAAFQRSKLTHARQSVPSATVIHYEKLDMPTRSSTDSNPTLSDTCNLNVQEENYIQPRVIRHEQVTGSDNELDVTAQELDELDQELNDLNKTGEKRIELVSDVQNQDFSSGVLQEPVGYKTMPDSGSGSHVSRSQRTSMNVPEIAGAGDSLSAAKEFFTDDKSSVSSSVRESAMIKPKALVLRPKPTDFVEEEGTFTKDRESPDDLLFGSPSRSEDGSQQTNEKVVDTLADYTHSICIDPEVVLPRAESNSLALRRPDLYMPHASPALSSDLTSFSRSENVKLRSMPLQAESVVEPDPVRMQALECRVQDGDGNDIPAVLYGNEFFKRQHGTLESQSREIDSSGTRSERTRRREKTDPLLARHKARQNMPKPSEFLRHLTKQAWAKPTTPTPVVANIPLPVLPSSDNTGVSPTTGVASVIETSQPSDMSQRQPDSLSDQETDLKRIPSFGSLRSAGTPSPSATDSPSRKLSDGGSAPGSMSPVDMRKPASEARQRRRSRSSSRDREPRKHTVSPAGDIILSHPVLSDNSSAYRSVQHQSRSHLQHEGSSSDFSNRGNVFPKSAAEASYHTSEDQCQTASGNYLQPPLEIPPPPSLVKLESFSGDPNDIHIDAQNMNTETVNKAQKESEGTQTRTDLQAGRGEPDLDQKSRTGAITTEKLSRFSPPAGFAPIHPQPVTAEPTRLSTAKSLSRDILSSRSQPLSVSTSTSGSIMRATSNLQRLATSGVPTELTAAKAHIIAAHEEQLAAITSLCKQEMKLLLAFRAGHKDTEEYVKRMGDILTLKLKTVNLLQDQIGALHSFSEQSKTSCT